MKHRTRTFGASIAVFLVTLMQAVAQAPTKTVARYHTLWLPDQGTEIAGKVDTLFNVILWITGIVFVLVFALMLVFIIRYRKRPGRKAIYYHGNTRLEIVWTVIPAVIVIGLGIASKSLWSQMKQDFPDEKSSLVIHVTPRQFEWDITYAGADGVFSPDSVTNSDDIKTINQLHVPAGKNVIIVLTAQDVIHSFFVPEFRMKQDAVPGMVTKAWFNTPKPGSFEIACAELCGLGHYRMRGYLTVHSQEDYDKWYNDQMAQKAKELAPPPPAPAPADTAASHAGAASTTDTVAAASSAPAGGSAGASAGASATDTATGSSSAKGSADTAAKKSAH
jgi:cytochrome c oxidase subunit 2